MNTQNDSWIKIEDKKPTRTDLPFWAVTPAGVWLWEVDTDERDIFELSRDRNIVTHWKPATVPAPPAKEKTQREMDEEAFRSWLHRAMPFDAVDAWHAALAYRDKQNAGDLSLLTGTIISGLYPIPHLNALRRRCGLDQ